MDKITADGLRFADSLGRTRIFSGFNIDDKLIDRDEFRYRLDEEFFKKYRANGLDFIRLAVTWQNIEPEAGKYNESYLRSIDGIFALAEKYGVYILLDMHQDLYSGFNGTGGGDGAPEWACLTDGYKAKPYKFVWAEAYVFGKWVHRCFDHFWNNDPVRGKGLQDRYAELWEMLARRYGDSSALFGFDFMNEPAPGTAGKKMAARFALSAAKNIVFGKKIKLGAVLGALLKKDMKKLLDSVPGSVVRDIAGKVDGLEAEFDLKYYSPFLNKMAQTVREVTPNGFLMIEQPFLCNGGVKLSVPAVTVGGRREPLQCFGPHAYDMTVDTPLYKYANADRVKAFFREMRSSQLRLDVPVVVGEWGGCSDNKDTSWFAHARELLDFFDEMQWGNAYWDYHGDDLDSPLMNILCRTHPVAVDGKIEFYRCNRQNGVFTLKFSSEKGGESLVFVHKPFEAARGLQYKTVESYENGASLILIKSEAGENTVTLKIKSTGDNSL